MPRSKSIRIITVVFVITIMIGCGGYAGHQSKGSIVTYDNECKPIPFSPVTHKDRFYVPAPIPLKEGMVTHSKDLVEQAALINIQKHLKLFIGDYTHEWWADLWMWTDAARRLFQLELEKRDVEITDAATKRLNIRVTCARVIWQFHLIRCIMHIEVETGDGNIVDFTVNYATTTLYDACNGAVTCAIADILNNPIIITYLSAGDSDFVGVDDKKDKHLDTPQSASADMDRGPSDSDGDGIADDKDRCPDTPRGVEVDVTGCPPDDDKDRVPNYLDKCPGTPQGARVDKVGCWSLQSVLFDFNKSHARPDYYYIFDEVVAVLKNNPNLKIEVQGHTDNIGSERFNLNLSKNRALWVKQYLIKKGIHNNRIHIQGYGFSVPRDSNDTDEGRARNRRTEIKPIYK